MDVNYTLSKQEHYSKQQIKQKEIEAKLNQQHNYNTGPKRIQHKTKMISTGWLETI